MYGDRTITTTDLEDPRVIKIEPIIEKARFGDGDVVSNQWAVDYFKKYTPITGERVEVGDLATLYVGSDSYAYTVGALHRFKTGARAGQVKSITLAEDRHRTTRTFYAYPTVCPDHTEIVDDCVPCLLQKHGVYQFRTEKGYNAQTVRVGCAIDYRDPSF